MLLTGQCGVSLQDPVTSNAGEEKHICSNPPDLLLHMSPYVCVRTRDSAPSMGFPSPLGLAWAPGPLRASQHRATEPALCSGGLTGKHHSCPSGGVSSMENTWRTSSPPGESPPGREQLTGVSWAGSHRCLREEERKRLQTWAGLRRSSRGPISLL